MILWIFAVLLAGADEKYAADLYDLEGKTLLFKLEAQRTMTADTMTYTAIYKNLDGSIAAQEKGETKNGIFTKYEASRPAMNESGNVEVKEGKILFSYTEKNKTQTSKDNFKPDSTLFSGTIVPHLQVNLDKILAKQELPFSYVVWYRKETVGFKFVYDKEEGDDVIAKMVPINLLYRSLVNPLYFTVNKKTKKLVSIKGRTMPKMNVDGKWKDTDALALYK